MSKSPILTKTQNSNDNDSFGQLAQDVIDDSNAIQVNAKNFKYLSNKTIPMINESNNNFIRKSTLDDSDNCFNQHSISSFSSPEERAMQQKIISNFKLNPFPFENIEEDYNDNSDDHYEASQEYDQNQNIVNLQQDYEGEMFNVFQPFMQNEEFQTLDSHEHPSSGPIFSLMNQTDHQTSIYDN